MKKLMILLLLQAIAFSSYCAVEFKYPVSEIPEPLLENADAVVRLDEGYFQVLSPGKAVYKTKFVITVLNKNGDEHAAFFEYYDSNTKITNLSAKLYNALGKCIRTADAKDFDDMSAAGGYALFADYRVKYTKPVSSQYPYTVEFKFEKTIDGLLFYPDKHLIPDYRVSVQESNYKVVVPKALGLRFKHVNFDTVPEIIQSSQNTQYYWKFSNITAIEGEPYGPPFENRVPYILFGANDFEIEGYRGNMSSWVNLGKWQKQLLDGLDVLPEATVQKMHELVKNCANEEEKIRLIYKYVQQKTRYVLISLGIGGWKPFPAKVVDEVGYGDCKALSNYTVSLLKAIGIKAHYATINSGKNESDIIIDFPSKQSDHIIVCVPLEKDTIWLECTDQFSPFGFLGMSTDDRHSLIITDGGGKIVKTPAYPKDSNLMVCSSTVYVDHEGFGKADQKLVYKSIFYDYAQEFLIESSDQQKRWLLENIEIPNFNIINFSSCQYGDRYPTAVITQQIELPGYATKTGNRLFVPLKMMDREVYVPRKVNDRKTDIHIRRDFIRADTIKYILPEGYKIEYKPGDFSVESVFGSCSSKIIETSDGILYIRRSETNKGVFPKTEYDNMIDYYKQIAKADKAQLVLVKQ